MRISIVSELIAQQVFDWPFATIATAAILSKRSCATCSPTMTCARRFRRVKSFHTPRDRSINAWVATHNADVARAPFDASWTRL